MYIYFDKFSVCSSVDVRNSPSYMEKAFDLRRFKNCTVIEGYLRFVLLNNETIWQGNLESLQFPRLREITGHLMVFHVR